MSDELAKMVMALGEEADADLLVYNGDISDQGFYDVVCKVRELKSRTNVLMVLSTQGGNGHAGYRIARYLSDAYCGFQKF